MRARGIVAARQVAAIALCLADQAGLASAKTIDPSGPRSRLCAIVLGKRGIRELDADDAMHGEDPLAGFGPHTGGFLRRLAGYTNAGDIIVNGAYDPSTGQVIGIDDLVGAHGGVGGMQTRPFIVYPSDWTEREPELVGAASVHRFLRRHALDEEVSPDDRSAEPGAAATDADRCEPLA